MQISKLGEFGLIEGFRKHIKTDSSVIKGSGDDCAVVALDKKRYLLLTCDMIIEGVDFLKRDDPYLIGRKAVAVSISDIAACAGLARYCLISVGIPGNSAVKYIDRLFKGMRDMAAQYKVNIVGGDISRAKHLTIDVSMTGVVEKNRLVLRSGASRGDIIFVTGALGGSKRGGRHLKFIPRIKEARLLTGKFKPTSMIDISDGLAQDLRHILEESRVGAVLYEELIPLSHDARGLSDALYAGEDFELLFTMVPGEAKKLSQQEIKAFKPIGEIVKSGYGLRLIDRRGREKIIRSRGFRHF